MQVQSFAAPALPKHSAASIRHNGGLLDKTVPFSSSARIEPVTHESTSMRLVQLGFSAAVVSRMVNRRQHCSKIVANSVATEKEAGQYAQLVAENRMITIEESNLRYAGALVIFILGVYSYFQMVAAGVIDYNGIAANAAGVWILFETGRQSICGCVLALRWNLDKPFSMTAPPAEYQGFIKEKRLQAFEIGGPGVLVGAAVATLAAAVNSELAAVVPTLQSCAVFGAFSFLIPVVARKLEENSD